AAAQRIHLSHRRAHGLPTRGGRMRVAVHGRELVDGSELPTRDRQADVNALHLDIDTRTGPVITVGNLDPWDVPDLALLFTRFDAGDVGNVESNLRSHRVDGGRNRCGPIV